MIKGSPASLGRVIVLVGVGLVALTAAALFRLRTQPAFSEDELAVARRTLDELRATGPSAGDDQCRRPSLGDGPAAPPGALATLLDPAGKFGPCPAVGGRWFIPSAEVGNQD